MTGSLKCVQLLISCAVRHCIHKRPNVFSGYRNHAWDLCRRNLSGNGFANTSGVTSFSRRTHLCGELRSSNVGQEVVLCGWLQFFRQQEFETLLSDLRYGSVLEVQGTVRSRPEDQKNEKMLTGEIEIIVSHLKLLNPCMPNLPFEPKGFHQVKEALRMEYRYLDLRQQKMQRNLRLRSKMVMKMRHFLADEHEFVEVETPTLFRRTPGGAKEFVVPSRHPGMFYSLPQSPQQFKQLLMVGGVDRYFQIARCYRDEGAKPDRQPEFTQVDLEMSFIDQEGVMSLVENLVQRSWPEERGMAKVPFPRIPYIEAMKQYGSDKPDTRLAWKIKDVTELLLHVSSSIFPKVQSEGSSFQALRIPAGSTHLSNKDLEEAMMFAKKGLPPTLMLVLSKVKANNALSGYLSKHLPETVCQQLAECLSLSADDILFLSCGHKHDPLTVLGRIRLQCADKMEEKGLELRGPKSLNFLWVNEFPLFLPKEDGGEGLESAHHPFTAPHSDDEDLLYTCPEQARSQHYDLVLNGQEIGGGSIRIHNASLQRHVLSNILKEDCSQLEHLLTALNSGCPPHGGIALGLDRLMAIVCEEKSIRDVIAFPKSHDGHDLMSHSPTTVLQQYLDAYHIVVKK